MTFYWTFYLAFYRAFLSESDILGNIAEYSISHSVCDLSHIFSDIPKMAFNLEGFESSEVQSWRGSWQVSESVGVSARLSVV